MSGKSTFTEDTGDAICERLIEGESLRSICRDENMPNAATVCRWLAANQAFREQYALARESQGDTYADEIVDIADDKSNDTIKDEQGQERPNTEWITRSRLRVDARKWVASKLKPKVYGDKTLLGSDPENPLPSGFDVSLIAAPLKRLTDASKG